MPACSAHAGHIHLVHLDSHPIAALAIHARGDGYGLLTHAACLARRFINSALRNAFPLGAYCFV